MAEQTSKPSITQFVDTVNTLWGSDRVLRTIMFSCALVAESPEDLHNQVSPEARAICKRFQGAFSQARYITRIYGTFDAVDGLLHDAPKAHTPSENTAKVVMYSVGGVAYHLLEHVALIMSLIRQVDEKLIPKTKGWLVRAGLWERGDDIDACAQWCWLIDCLCGVYLGLCNYRRAEAALKEARKQHDRAAELRAKGQMLNIWLDMTKTVCDIPLAVHYGAMTSNRGYRGVLDKRLAATFGVVGSVAQLYSRFRKNA